MHQSLYFTWEALRFGPPEHRALASSLNTLHSSPEQLLARRTFGRQTYKLNRFDADTVLHLLFCSDFGSFPQPSSSPLLSFNALSPARDPMDTFARRCSSRMQETILARDATSRCCRQSGRTDSCAPARPRCSKVRTRMARYSSFHSRLQLLVLLCWEWRSGDPEETCALGSECRCSPPIPLRHHPH